MSKLGIQKKIALPLLAGAIFFGTITVVFAESAITPSIGPPPGTDTRFYQEGNKPVTEGQRKGSDDVRPLDRSENSKSFLREWTFENSFDKSADSVQKLEKNLAPGINYNCSQYLTEYKLEGYDKPFVGSVKVAEECQRRQNLANGFKGEVSSIKGQQRTFAEVSRVGDIAAVGSIGAVAYSEVMHKKGSQADTYHGAAKIETVAGVASYTTGAADVAMGAWAYINQKKKLEQIQETLSGTQNGAKGKSGNSTLDSNVSRAIENTKQAAYNHMLYGMGKVAVGYASMKLAKRSKEQAEMLESIDSSAYNLPASSISTVSATAGSGGPVQIQTNQPSFSISTVTATNTGSSSGSGSTGSSNGSSAMPSNELRSAVAATKAAASGVGSSSGSSSSLGGGSSGDGASRDPASLAVEAAVKPSSSGSLGEFSRGGGAPSFGGGGSHSATDDVAASIGGLMGGIMGGGGEAKGVAATINPDQLYEDGTAGISGNEQGSMAGVNSNSNKTLFEIIKVKNTKALQLGNVQGPSGVEIKN